ncbi:hypothetical protein OH491_00615 [Termitidicoccus mucosus]|uniref:autotransporter-associated beta strand repeat-containing protein n=1 Tax=Termitidicoccus mucosus TaxID=1184151 RepID=UPI003183A3DA
MANNAQVLLHTGGISGDFAAKSVSGGTSQKDFLTFGAFIVGGTDYVLGTQLTWLSGTDRSHGNFTLGEGEVFNVDVALGNTTPHGANLALSDSWDGASLTVTSSNRGDLILSASNSYSGTTLVNGGTLTITGYVGARRCHRQRLRHRRHGQPQRQRPVAHERLRTAQHRQQHRHRRAGHH